MRQIKASEVKPGMTIRWEQGGITYECTVSSVVPASFGVNIMARQSAATIYNETLVTVLPEPAPAQPEEPAAFGAKARVRDRCFLRMGEVGVGCYVWFEKGSGNRWSWDDLCKMGPVTVVPDQGWTVQDDTPEVPDRIEKWDTWEDVPEGVVVIIPGLFCRYRKNQGVVEFSDPDNDPDWTKAAVRALPRSYGPWTRIFD